MIVRSRYIFTSTGVVDGYLCIEDGKIVSIQSDYEGIVDIDCGDKRVIPGIIDTHNHGTMGYGLFSETKDHKREFLGYLKGLASQGVTACLPTADIDFFETIAHVAKTPIDGAIPIGIHSEGPYLNRVGEKGVDTGHPDIDLDYCKEMVDKAGGMLKLVAIAPELPKAKEAIEYFCSQGIRCAFAHSNQLYKEALESFRWGITVTTHTANVMEGMHHRHMGGLGACLLNDEVYNELICDGLHVSNEMIEIMLRVKKNPLDKILMVSDSTPMSGAPLGRYKLDGHFEVNIDEKGFCLSDTGRLMGSTVPVIKGIKNLVENFDLSLSDVLKMSSRNPAIVYGAKSKGELAVGKDADFVIIDDQYNALSTYREGVCIYNKEKDQKIFNSDFLPK
ncbi:MAG: N-acetylglucosamine-6-phosphate deacetylase [Anaerorhabdus sp.]